MALALRLLTWIESQVRQGLQREGKRLKCARVTVLCHCKSRVIITHFFFGVHGHHILTVTHLITHLLENALKHEILPNGVREALLRTDRTAIRRANGLGVSGAHP